MSKAIKIYAISPEKDYAGIEFFFKHLEDFLNHKEQILQCEDLYRIPIAGMGICGLFLGECPVCLGDLMLLYQDAWKFNQGEDTRYLIHMAGSPLSGRNSCSFWSITEQKIVSGEIESFSHAFIPLNEVKRKNPKFSLNLEKVTGELLFLSEQLIDFYTDFIIERQEKQQRQETVDILQGIIDPNPDKNGVNALMRYCQAGDMGAIRLVWKHSREQFDAKTKDGLTPVNFAAKHLRVLQFLFKHGKTDFSVSPIASACEVKDDVEKRLDLLFAIGADINAKNDDGEPPIVVAAEAFNVKAIRWLLKHGADKTATNANGETARDIVLKNKEAFDWKNILKSL